MTEEQRREILAFSTNSCRLPAVSTAQAMLHRAFESRAAEEPGRTALVYQSASMTYGELNRTANAVAHALLDRGARLGTVIAGRLERSPDLIIFLLGVLKAGAICLPLDPWYPIERTRRILADARPEIVISHGGLLADIPGIDIAALKLGNAANPGCVVEDDQPSFLLYTSGSTGRPKGVLITYGGRGRRQFWTQRRYNADESDRHLLKSPVGFGTLLRETFWPLTTGGTIVIANAGGQADVSYLARLIVHEGITIANFVPSLLREFLDHPDATACTTLKHVVCTGEALPMDLQKRFQSRLPAARLHLFYGSTELPTATYHDFAETESERFITIGRPAGVPVYVLNEQLDLAPVGEPGEIFVGGPDLALGYYGHPEMTAERFIPDRFANSPGARLFRTGDRARWHADGRLEYLGRADEQVKIRGCRVELGEVREAIRAFPCIRDVAVISAITGDSGTRIVAFYIPGEHAPSTRELRRHLAARLPTYMIPARLIQLDRFPLDAHGKLNRQKLGAIAVEHVTEREIGDPPLGALEEKLASIWCDAMDLDSVGRDEAFSDLGGDSISALRIVSDIRESLDFEIPVSTLFARATIRQVAEEIRSLERPVLNPPVMYEHLQGDSLWRLSSAQRRLWFLHVLNRENKAYNVAVAFQLAGDVDVNVLQDKLNSIVSRHEVLRSSVVMKDGEPYQCFIPECTATLSIVYGPKDQASDWLASFMARPLDLSTPPQLHASLFRTDEQHHILALLLPHFVCDRLSLRIIRCELFGEQRQFPSSRYSDFITQEQSWLNTPAALIALESWKRKFEDRPALVEIPGTVPISRAVAEGTLDAADSRSRPLRKDLLDGINSLSSRERCTPFAVFWTALAILVGRLARKTDIVIGVPVDCRRARAYDGTVGCFVNPIPLRINLRPGICFLQALEQAKEAIGHGLTNAAVPFESIVEAVNPQRTPHRNPLFEICFNFDAHQGSTPTSDGIEVERLEIPEAGAKFDLNFYVSETRRGCTARLVFRRTLYQSDWASCVLESYETLLTQVVADPHALIESYSLISPSFRHHVPDLRIPIDVPEFESVIAQFGRIAASQPDLPAVDCRPKNALQSDIACYRELDRDAINLATKLVQAGVCPGDCVALLGNHCRFLPAAVLAVWKIGAIFLLLDENLPDERQAVMMQEACAGFLLRFATGDTTRWPVCRDSTQATVTHTKPFEDAAPACIFFTSGTSGTPKAVLFSHQAIAHFLAWEREMLAVTNVDRIALVMPLSFDAILRDMLLPLTSGGTVCIAPDGPSIQWLRSQRITILHAVPSIAQAWIGGLIRPMTLPDLRWVLFSGEPLTDSFVCRWREYLGGYAGIMNVYGPTETTMCKCVYKVPGKSAGAILPVGSPMPCTQVLVVAENGRLCGMGEFGEILLRTPFRAFGYLNSPDVQEDRFVRNPQRPDDSSDLLYRTGDWGRFRADGLLEIWGRKDRQVKIHGARVEPEEIEQALAALPDVSEAAVVAAADIPGGSRLIAYVVPKGGNSVDPVEIRTQLRKRLPSFMIPSAFIALAQMPRTHTGKLDRAALSTAANPADISRDVLFPRTLLEFQLTEIWEEILRLDRIGVKDNFFDLGGHSLLAIQLAAKVESKLGYSIAPSDLFPDATIEHLAGVIDQSTKARTSNPLVPIQCRNGNPALFCVHPAGGSVFCYADLARSLGHEISVFGLQGPDPRGSCEPSDSVCSMAAEYIRCLRAVQRSGPYFLAGFSLGGLIAFEMGQQLRNEGETVGFVALLDTGHTDSEDILNSGGLIRELCETLERYSFSESTADEEEYQLWRDLHALARRYVSADPKSSRKPLNKRLGAAQECFRMYRLLPAGDDLRYGDLRRYLQYLRANLRAARKYRAIATLNPIVFVGAAQPMPGERPVIERRAEFWRSMSLGGFELLKIAANHVTLLTAPGVNIIGEGLRARINQTGTLH